MKKASLNDIAKSLKVSKTLVSFVLNNQGDKKGISTKTQAMVLKKAEELNYKPNQIARGLRLGKTHTIGLIVADISNKFYAKVAKKVEQVATLHNYNLIFCSSDENPEKEIQLINMLKERQVDGIIISTTQENASIFTRLKKENYPFVLIDRNLPKLISNFAGVDNYTGAFEATEHLLMKGYKRIALLKISPLHLSTIKEREQGYRYAFKKNGIRINNKLIKTIPFSSIEQSVSQVLDELLQDPFKIDAIFSTNNNIAIACLEYINKMNLQIPKDVALVSFDDIDLFRFSYPSITAISQPIEDIGKEAVNILLNEIDNTSINKKQVVLPVGLIKRKSC